MLILKNKMTKKEVKEIANQTILSGKSKQETFEELKGTCNLSEKDLAKIIQKIPSIEAKKKYRILYVILEIILLLTILFKMRIGIHLIIEEGIQNVFQITLILFLLPIINILLLIGVARYKRNSFKWIAIFMMIGLSQYIRSDIILEEEGVLIFIDLAIHIVLFVLALYLYSKFFPKYLTVNEIHQDTQGQVEYKNVIKFED